MKKLLLSAAAVSVFCAPSAYAETTQQEFAAISKIASLCQTFKGKGVEVAVVYSNASAKSVKDKDSLVGFAKSANLKTTSVTVSKVSSSSANVIILADGLSATDFAKVKSSFAGKPVITASSDLTCVESGKCLLGVNVGSVVKLLVHSKTYSDSGLRFDPAFEFMVKQI